MMVLLLRNMAEEDESKYLNEEEPVALEKLNLKKNQMKSSKSQVERIPKRSR